MGADWVFDGTPYPSPLFLRKVFERGTLGLDLGLFEVDLKSDQVWTWGSGSELRLGMGSDCVAADRDFGGGEVTGN